MLDMKEIANQMKELEIKASKYDDLKEMLESTMAKINEKFNEIQDLFSEISPLLAVRKKYKTNSSTGFGTVIIGYVEKLYEYLVESEEEISVPEIFKKLNMDDSGLLGGTGSKVKEALRKMHGIKSRIDANDRRRHLFSYDSSVKKIDMAKIPEHIKEVVKKKEVGELKVEVEGNELKKSMPKKFSHLG